MAIGESCFKVLIDTDFRKKYFESTGKMLERMTEISFNLELLSPEIRKLLIEVYFFGGDFRLDTNQPLYVPNGPDIRKAKNAWEANLSLMKKTHSLFLMRGIEITSQSTSCTGQNLNFVVATYHRHVALYTKQRDHWRLPQQNGNDIEKSVWF